MKLKTKNMVFSQSDVVRHLKSDSNNMTQMKIFICYRIIGRVEGDQTITALLNDSENVAPYFLTCFNAMPKIKCKTIYAKRLYLSTRELNMQNQKKFCICEISKTNYQNRKRMESKIVKRNFK